MKGLQKSKAREAFTGLSQIAVTIQIPEVMIKAYT